MSDGYAASWYRVAPLCPRLRAHAEIHRHVYRDQVWHVLQDHQSGRFFRGSPAARLMLALRDGPRSMADLARIIGVLRSTLHLQLTGRRPMPAETAAAIRRALPELTGGS